MDLSNIFQKLVTTPLDTGTVSIEGTPLDQEVLQKLYELLKQKDLTKLSLEEKSQLTWNLQTLAEMGSSCKEQVEKIRQVLADRNGLGAAILRRRFFIEPRWLSKGRLF